MAVFLWLLVVSSASNTVASDSILDIINTQEVEQFIAERRANVSKESNIDTNLLDDEEEDDEPTSWEIPLLR